MAYILRGERLKSHIHRRSIHVEGNIRRIENTFFTCGRCFKMLNQQKLNAISIVLS
jgi:hypothetical protein